MKPVINPSTFISETQTTTFEVIPAFVVSTQETTLTEHMLHDPQTWILGAIAFFLLILVLRGSGSSKKKGE